MATGIPHQKCLSPLEKERIHASNETMCGEDLRISTNHNVVKC